MSDPRRTARVNLGLGLIILSGLAWVAVVMVSGFGFNATGVAWNFERTGQLGDSFGVLSSAMASIAAYFAYRTYRATQHDSVIADQRAFEASFLNLTERRSDVLGRVNLIETWYGASGVRSNTYDGQAALDRVRTRLLRAVDVDGHGIKSAYEDATANLSGLSSYLRYTYHLVAILDRRVADSGRTIINRSDLEYQLARLLRAQMSDAELVIIALNCIVGSGFAKFRPLVERYSLLHNIPIEEKARFRLDDFFAAGAFGLSARDRAGPADTPPQAWLDAVSRAEGRTEGTIER